jgi:hypothetical protein
MVKNPGMIASTLKFTGKLARSFAGVLGVCTAIVSQPVVALGAPATRSASDTFSIGGQPVTVIVTVATPENRRAVITETFKNARSSFNRNSSIEILAGVGPSRIVEDVSLAPLGLSYILHLTLALREGMGIYIEHALLLPGAVPLK